MMRLERFQNANIYLLALKPKKMSASRPGDGEKKPQECWKVTSAGEKILLGFLLVCFILLVALFVFTSYHFLYEEKCDNAKCIEGSYKLLQILDVKVNACSDFHAFICKNQPSEDGVQNVRLKLIQEEITDTDSALLKSAKTFYNSCRHEDGIMTLQTLISQIGGWPLLMGAEWNEANFNWQNYMVEVRPWGIKSDWLLSFDYYQNENNTNLLLILPPKLEKFSFQLGSGYYQEMIGLLVHKFQSYNLLQGQLKQMIEFENNLHTISKKARLEILEYGDYTEIPISKINKLWPTDLLFENLNALARGYAVFTNSTIVVVASESYLYELYKLLMATPKRTQANYFIWKTIETFLPFLSGEIRTIYAKFVHVNDTDELCYNETLKRFYNTIEREIFGETNKGKTNEKVEKLAKLIYKRYNNSEDITVVVGDAAGVTNVNLMSSQLIRMICQIEFYIENQFYHCLHRNIKNCFNEVYYDNRQKSLMFFDTLNQTIYIPYNLVNSDDFVSDQPDYINFARLGTQIADEILEAEEVRLNNTIDKNGVNLAYEGYIEFLQNNGMEEKLPALSYTIKQLFWIHAGLAVCNEDYKFEEILQSTYFRKDFQCN